LVLSAIVAVAVAAGLSQSPPADAEPLKLAGAHPFKRAAAVNGWKMTPVVLAGATKGDSGRVASAMSRLDLSKLTMADFGDVEQSR
jgi:hypothetical protein